MQDFANLHASQSATGHNTAAADALPRRETPSAAKAQLAPSPAGAISRTYATVMQGWPQTEQPEPGFSIALPPPSSPEAPGVTAQPHHASAGGALAEQAYQKLRDGNRKQAATLFAQAIELSPGDPRARIWAADRQMLVRRWSGDAYVLVRQGGTPRFLGATPTLGGSQAGARLAYVFNPLSDQRLTLSGRVYQPLARHSGRTDAMQTVVGLELQPSRAIPVTIALDRYIAIGGQARDAWAVRVSGGMDSLPLASGFTASFYGQAGIIGTRSRDGYADGWAKLQRPLAGNSTLSVKGGAGIWAGVQPGASRVDVGPTAQISGRIGATHVSAAVDYRIRAAGNARPGNGPSVTLQAGF